ncbi:hypothetical protein B0H14DRAFT_3531887 [Mycena olivaceomarginata]|nr:hypothetical protein B0H14DRAFT_3531887 [Mycena olivaceomarginata]
MPPKDAANWVANPEDLTQLINFFHGQRSRVGEGGNWDKTVLNEAVVHMASLGPPAKGGPKTFNSVSSKWKDVRKLHESILQMKEKTYPGASGWNYDDDLGFSAHPIFKPFATSGWKHFKTVDEIIPSRARGRFVFSAGSTQLVNDVLGSQIQSLDSDDVPLQLSQSLSSQPLTDWSQSNFGESQPLVPANTDKAIRF